jgi:hypothetical protein
MIEVADLMQATTERAWVEDGGLVLPTGRGNRRLAGETAGPTEITC